MVIHIVRNSYHLHCALPITGSSVQTPSNHKTVLLLLVAYIVFLRALNTYRGHIYSVEPATAVASAAQSSGNLGDRFNAATDPQPTRCFGVLPHCLCERKGRWTARYIEPSHSCSLAAFYPFDSSNTEHTHGRQQPRRQRLAAPLRAARGPR